MRARLGERSAFVALVPQRDRLGTQRLGPCELALHVSLVHVRYRLWLHARRRGTCREKLPRSKEKFRLESDSGKRDGSVGLCLHSPWLCIGGVGGAFGLLSVGLRVPIPSSAWCVSL